MTHDFVPHAQRVRQNASPRSSAKPRRYKTHIVESQRTLCGLRISMVPEDMIVYLPTKVTCGACKRVLANRKKRA